MTVSFDATYEGGVLKPAAPLDLPDGTVVQVTVIPAVVLPAPGYLDLDAVRARIKRIAELPMEPGGDPTVTARDHDRTLYGGPGGAR